MGIIFDEEKDGFAWEDYCEKLLNLHYQMRNFFPVPHADRGDYGIEFFTSDGTIFQCYAPSSSSSMQDYKRLVQKKINDDLKKLTKNQAGISELLDGILINQWVLFIPEVRSKELISYCNRKARELLVAPPSFIDKSSFRVRVIDDSSYPLEKYKARLMMDSEINFPVREVSQDEKNQWKSEHTIFHDNLVRKCGKIQQSPNDMVDALIGEYLVLEDLVVAYRENFPDLHKEIATMVAGNLSILRTNAIFSKGDPAELVRDLLNRNREKVGDLKQKISTLNSDKISVGYISKWIAECKMDFILS